MFNKIKNSLFGNKSNSKSDSIFSNTQNIESYDSELWLSLKQESQRQEDHIELIASENYASNRILEACLLYTSPSPRDGLLSRMPSSA